MRCHRVRMSISVWSSMWPMCNEPVTLGGGITMEKTGPGAAGSALNNSSFTQNSAQRGSICCGSYALAISRVMPRKSPGFPVAQRKKEFAACRGIFEYTWHAPRTSIGDQRLVTSDQCRVGVVVRFILGRNCLQVG